MSVDLVVSVVVTMLGTWLLVVVLLVVARPRDMDLTEARHLAPDLVRLIGRLARDPSLGRSSRVRLSLLLAYLASPVDIVPDFVPVLGYADDVIIVAIALRGVVRRSGTEALDGGTAARPAFGGLGVGTD